MPKKLETVWDADSHTLAKIAILNGYLDAWFPILGTKISKSLVYIDGFAGPGKYRCGAAGSPMVAIQAARSGLDRSGDKFLSEKVHLFFVEKDPRRHAHLRTLISGTTADSPRLEVHEPINAEFSTALPEIIRSIPTAFHGDSPVFVFADPFGATGMPFHVLKEAVKGSSAELLINLDADGIRRIYQASNINHASQLSELFGCDDWIAFDACGNDHHKLHREILALYKKQIRKIDGMKYVWQFGMRGLRNTLSYYLVFATKNPLGMEKMKESMKHISQNGSYSFSDASVDQEHLMFNADDISIFSEALWQNFFNKSISYSLANDFALNETPFTNPKSMLAKLEFDGKLEVQATRKRSKGKFPADAIKSISFRAPPARQLHPTQSGFDFQ